MGTGTSRGRPLQVHLRRPDVPYRRPLDVDETYQMKSLCPRPLTSLWNVQRTSLKLHIDVKRTSLGRSMDVSYFTSLQIKEIL